MLTLFNAPNKPNLWLWIWSFNLFCYPMKLGAFIYFGRTRVQCLKLVRNIVRNYNNCKSSVLVSNQIPTYHSSKNFPNLNFPPNQKPPFSKNHKLFWPVLPVSSLWLILARYFGRSGQNKSWGSEREQIIIFFLILNSLLENLISNI